MALWVVDAVTVRETDWMEERPRKSVAPARKPRQLRVPSNQPTFVLLVTVSVVKDEEVWKNGKATASAIQLEQPGWTIPPRNRTVSENVTVDGVSLVVFDSLVLEVDVKVADVDDCWKTRSLCEHWEGR